jgi:hypothetical protein
MWIVLVVCNPIISTASKKIDPRDGNRRGGGATAIYRSDCINGENIINNKFYGA